MDGSESQEYIDCGYHDTVCPERKWLYDLYERNARRYVFEHKFELCGITFRAESEGDLVMFYRGSFFTDIKAFAIAQLDCHMHNPLQWNGEREWTFNFLLNHAQLYLLRDHVTLLTDLTKDWTSGPATTLQYFIPMEYKVKVTLTDFDMFFCVNQNNVINQPNDLNENGTSISRRRQIAWHNGTLIPSPVLFCSVSNRKRSSNADGFHPAILAIRARSNGCWFSDRG